MGPFRPRQVIWCEEEFMNGSGLGKFASASSGGTAVATTTGIAENHDGLIILTTGTGTTGRGAISSAELKTGGYTVHDAILNVTQLSTASEEFILDVGFGNTFNSNSEFTDGVFFRYDRLTSVNWIRGTANNSSVTLTASSTAVEAAAFLHLQFVINAATNSVEFFVNGSSLGSNSTNIPANTQLLRWGARIVKSAGTTSVSTVIDYLGYRKTLNTSR